MFLIGLVAGKRCYEWYDTYGLYGWEPMGNSDNRHVEKKPIVNCPQCGKVVVWETGNRYRPFCSERCKLIDLGQWAAESYRIPEAEKQEGELPDERENQKN